MLSGLKNFGVTFLISIVLFGILAYFATLFVSSTVNSILDDESKELNHIIQGEETGDKETESSDTPGVIQENLPKGTSFSLLLITTDYRPDLYDDYAPSAETIAEKSAGLENAVPTLGLLSQDFRKVRATTVVFVRADREKQKYVYTYFTPEMQVYTPGGYRTLSDIYTLYGTAALAEYINAMTGLKVNYTAVLDGYHFDNLTDLLGPAKVTLPRDVYTNGSEITMNYETLVQRVGTDGYPWTEHVPNTWLMGAGINVLNGEGLYTLSLAAEHTEAERDAKQQYVLEVVRGYMEKLAAAGEKDGKTLFEQMITAKSDWMKIEGYEPSEEELAESAAAQEETKAESEKTVKSEPETAAIPDDLPFDPTPFDPTPFDEPAADLPELPVPENPDEANGEDTEEETEEEEELPPIWLIPVGEPDTPILSTNCTAVHFANNYELLKATGIFEAVSVTYPCTFTPATDRSAEFYTVRLKDGLDLFLPYRSASQ